jgi:phosphoribosylglycinamide formyltransferase-1
MTLSLVVLASGRGSNFAALLDAIATQKCDAKVLALLSDNPHAGAVAIARQHGVRVEIVDFLKLLADSPHGTNLKQHRLLFESKILNILESLQPDIIVLAGYMRILLHPEFFKKYRNRILNIHPSLLPKYPGAHAQADAFAAGEKISGLTIHLVDESLDNGPILFQEKVDISSCKSADEVSARILAREHLAYPRVIDGISKGRYPLVSLPRR